MKLDDLPENQLRTLLLDLEASARNIKNRQLASGSYNVEQYLNQTGSTWDYDLNVNTGSTAVVEEHEFVLGFQADNQNFAFGTPFMDIFINNTTHLNENVSTYTDGGGNTARVTLLNDWTGVYFTNDTGYFEWYSRVIIAGSLNIKVKMYVRSTDTGTIIKGHSVV